MFIQLTSEYGNAVVVNTDQIITMKPTSTGGTIIRTTGDVQPVTVTDDINSILNRMARHCVVLAGDISSPT